MKTMQKGVIRFRFDETVILTLYIALKPLYISSSGSMQICDIVFAVSIVYMLIKNKFTIRFSKNEFQWIKPLLIFTVFVLLVNSCWFVRFEIASGMTATSFLTNSLYYIFNLCAAAICVIIVRDVGLDRAIDAICKGCVWSAAINLLGVLINQGRHFRTTGFFNNPNQLGFYSIILITFLLYFRNHFKRWERVLIFLTACYSIILSLSKASFVCLFIVCFMFVVVQDGSSRKKRIRKGILLIAIAAALYLFLFTDVVKLFHSSTLTALRSRILNMFSENDSSLGSGRGYNRVFEMGSHILWGMGEGYYGRFKTMPGYEIHSTYASLLVSYGVIGVVMFVSVFAKIFAQRRWIPINIAYLSGILLYCFTHNGIRNTLFWILISFIWIYQNAAYMPSHEQTDLRGLYGSKARFTKPQELD